ncbi:hypothetical protein LCGC14_1251250 [marine sediment metagenome]|uniref:Uncharacterized protein n=1 Tax=marine sediment metagenome TaxID=412755 RepID=A0A0F9P6X7_9ZZZZ
MTNQKKWTALRLIGCILMCLGLIVLGIATQGGSLMYEFIGFGGLFAGFCVFIYGLMVQILGSTMGRRK